MTFGPPIYVENLRREEPGPTVLRLVVRPGQHPRTTVKEYEVWHNGVRHLVTSNRAEAEGHYDYYRA